MAWYSRQLRGTISTRAGVFVAGYKSKFAIDPGLQDTVVPIVTAQLNALGARNVSSVYVYHDNRHPPVIPPVPQVVQVAPRPYFSRSSLDQMQLEGPRF